MDEQRLDEVWENFIDVLVQETMDGCDGASDEYLKGIIEKKVNEFFPSK